jgi:hypothetical protein
MLAAAEASYALRWHVVALVGNDQPIPGGERRDVVEAARVCRVSTSMIPQIFDRPPPSWRRSSARSSRSRLAAGSA